LPNHHILEQKFLLCFFFRQWLNVSSAQKGIQRILASEKMASTRVEAKRTKTQKWTE
jgi:hypothetical protein